MSLVLHTLPYEIIELVSVYTSTTDLFNAIQVSKSWYHFFHRFLYKSLSIDSYEKQQRILSAFQTEQLPGHHVRSLDLLKVQLFLEEIESIPKLFPNVDTLTIDWGMWGSHPFHSYFDSEAPISFIHPPQGLPSFIHNFFQHYGSHSLQSLSIDTLNNESTDIWSILALCPRLTSLKLINLNYEHIITLEYIEKIHQYCPLLTSLVIKCNRSDPNPALLPQVDTSTDPILLHPTLLQNFSLSSKSGSAKWPLWLPYFAIKYPHLQHVLFKHCGLGKEGSGLRDVPEKAYTLFTHGCRQLKSIRWSKIIVRHDQQKRLFTTCQSHHRREQKQPFSHLQRIDAYENFWLPHAIEQSPVVQRDTLMSNLLTSLTIGQPPVNVTTDQVIKAIGQCKNLIQLKIQECFVDPDLSYSIVSILTHCRKLHTLYFKDVHVDVGGREVAEVAEQHPLKKLIFKRSSFIQPVFKYISSACKGLAHVELLGCFQSDRRDQVVIDLPLQSLATLKIQGLRTRSYYAGCRVRFFSVNSTQEKSWYYMDGYDIRVHPVGRKPSFQKYRHMEFAKSLCRLDGKDIEQLQLLVTSKKLKAWDIEALKKNLCVPYTPHLDPTCWDPESIYYSGFVNINCSSIQNLFINNKLVVKD